MPIAELEKIFDIGEAVGRYGRGGGTGSSAHVAFNGAAYILLPKRPLDKIDVTFRRWPRPETNPLMLSHWLGIELGHPARPVPPGRPDEPDAVAMADRTSEPQRIDFLIQALEASRAALLGDAARTRAAAEHTIAAVGPPDVGHVVHQASARPALARKTRCRDARTTG